MSTNTNIKSLTVTLHLKGEDNGGIINNKSTTLSPPIFKAKKDKH